MTVKNLIKHLLNYDMDANVCVGVDKDHYNSYGDFCKGYLFDIDSVGDFGSVVELKVDIDDLERPFKDTDKQEIKKEVGCKNCANAPRTYEEFCLAKHSVDTSFCQDAFEEQAKNCNLYDKSLDKENKQ